MSLLNFKIQGVGKSATKLETKARSFSITVDEPESLGGKDEGPNPVEYILAGYAGCLNVVLNLVAKEKGIKIDQLNIRIGGDLNPAKLFGTSDLDRAGFQSLEVIIEIDSAASEAALQELLIEAKSRCPVNDTLANPTPIHYDLHRVAV